MISSSSPATNSAQGSSSVAGGTDGAVLTTVGAVIEGPSREREGSVRVTSTCGSSVASRVDDSPSTAPCSLWTSVEAEDAATFMLGVEVFGGGVVDSSTDGPAGAGPGGVVSLRSLEVDGGDAGPTAGVGPGGVSLGFDVVSAGPTVGAGPGRETTSPGVTLPGVTLPGEGLPLFRIS